LLGLLLDLRVDRALHLPVSAVHALFPHDLDVRDTGVAAVFEAGRRPGEMTRSRPYGVVAEFEDPDGLLAAARAARDRGYRRIEAYSPYSIEELDDVVRMRDYLPLIVLIGGITGAITGYVLQYYLSVIHYPLNIGGRPLHSWPAFIVITFELTILFAASAA